MSSAARLATWRKMQHLSHGRRRATSVGLLVVLAALGSGSSAAQVAEIENLGDSLAFHPIVTFVELILTVTGPCDFVSRQSFTEGEPLFTLDNETTIDGTYRYELVQIAGVAEDVRDMLLEARANDDTETAKQLCRERSPEQPLSLSQAGGFVVEEGKIVLDVGAFEAAAAPPSSRRAGSGRSTAGWPGPDSARVRVTAEDFVINDDLIVDGSACIGFDCLNGESFLTDTLRLREEVLRVHFDDTSSASHFPSTDWRIAINEASNGGLGMFSIEDATSERTPFAIEADARSHSLYVDGAGRVGSRSAAPLAELHTRSRDTPTLRLEQDASSGYPAQIWELQANETRIAFRDVTHGGSPLSVEPGAPTDSFHIDTSGAVGIGTASPTAALDVAGSLQVSGGARITGGFSASSTREIKRDFAEVDSAEVLERLRALPVKSWTYRSDEARARHFGPMAEDFYDAFGLGDSNRHIDLVDANGVTLAGLKGLLDRLDERDREVEALRERLFLLESRIAGAQDVDHLSP